MFLYGENLRFGGDEAKFAAKYCSTLFVNVTAMEVS
ncbi:hypothetical protein VIS19158_10564 [Vibrio scophthalmi LMG 19158]|uniref:Uncharacterized protein n=1 Tax=Vibrio scophthalmi LMG 19158 TaxID=870967 RepID=F9RIT0_9VIBR|nr:hypothetical protein VIS19158_10564 [Vibrio scophthalmi LMG 19158]